ncbi:MAG TPA: acyl-ACP--UDP-N-acetylglucosamine O-acyltransferase [Fimbriimonadaceae bacterium]|nr:acyl-ACP--UDP-N-acetylglucosamine O-acyltransferase [Fimbriimonadaceae bacterium]
MASIHPLAAVDPGAELAEDVVVGPFCFVEGGVKIGEGCRLDSHVTIKGGTTIGKNNTFAQGAIIGGDPQDRRYKGEPTFLEIGDNNVIREYVTIHRGSEEGGYTRVGSGCYLMAFVHLGHDCQVHDNVTITNSVGISGHCTIEERVTIGGMTAIHQWVRIGKVAMVGGVSRIVKDVPPFMLAEGPDQVVHDINAIGLRRYGVTQENRLALHKACKLLFKSQLGLSNAMETVRREVPMTPEVKYLLDFEEQRFRGKNGRGYQP